MNIGTLVNLSVGKHSYTGVIVDIRTFDDTTYLIHFTDGDFGWWTEHHLDVICK